ncbi:hypothetical protein BN1708_018945, partial [Verticillium longisporum]
VPPALAVPPAGQGRPRHGDGHSRHHGRRHLAQPAAAPRRGSLHAARGHHAAHHVVPVAVAHAADVPLGRLFPRAAAPRAVPDDVRRRPQGPAAD